MENSAAAAQVTLTELMQAVIDEDVERVKTLVVAKADVNAIEPVSGTNALILAAEAGNDAVVEALLSSRVIKINERRNDQWSALMAAAARGHRTIVIRLLERKPKRAIPFDVCKVAIAHDQYDIVRLLRDRYYLIDSFDFTEKYLQNVALAQRSAACRIPTIKALPSTDPVTDQSVASPQATVAPAASTEITRLMAASQGGMVPLVELYLDQGDAVDETDADGRTPLMVAAAGGHQDVVVALLKRGANRSLQTTTRPAVSHPSTVQSGVAEQRYLQGMSLRPDMIAKTNAMRYQVPLEDYATVIIEAQKIVMQARREQGSTPGKMSALMYATQGKHSEVVDLLLGEDTLHLMDDHGWDTLCYAAEAGEGSIISSMLSGHQRRFNFVLPQHMKALQIAIVSGHLSVIESIYANYEPQVLLNMMSETVDRYKLLLMPTIALFAEQGEILKFFVDYYKTVQPHVLEQVLETAVMKGLTKMVPTILQWDIAIDAPLVNDKTAAMHAISSGQFPMMALLLRYGADIFRADLLRMTVVTMAAKYERHDMLQLMAFSQILSEKRREPIMICADDDPRKAMLERVQYSQSPGDRIYRAILFNNLEQQSFGDNHWQLLHFWFMPCHESGPIRLMASYLWCDSILTWAVEVENERQQQKKVQGKGAADTTSGDGSQHAEGSDQNPEHQGGHGKRHCP